MAESPEVIGSTADPVPLLEMDAPRPAASVMVALWAFLLDARLLVVMAAFPLLLLGVSVLVPQMPGQIRNEPLAADRWLASATETLGFSGTLLRVTGLYDVLHSPLFRGLLGVLLFILLLHAANAMLIAVRFRRLHEVLDHTELPGGEPLPVTMPYALYRWRAAVAQQPVAAAAAADTQIRPWATHIERRTMRVAPSTAQVSEMPDAGVGPASILEERLLGIRGLFESALRPLLPVGLIVALAVVWWYSVFGNQFSPEPLLPGERASNAELGITVEYGLAYPQPNVIGPVLRVNKGALQQSVALGDGGVSVGDVVVQASPGAPAMVVRTLGDTLMLARPGQANTVSTLGLGFPNPGSEETLVLPNHGVGIRIIRQDNGSVSAADDSFAVEVFQGNSEEPVQRFPVADSHVERIVTPIGEVPLVFVPMPMFQVKAYSSPGAWNLVPALLLTIAGLIGFRRRPAFLLAQASAWPENRSVVIVQTDRTAALDELRSSTQPHEAHNGT